MITTALIVLFVVKSIVVDLIVLWIFKEFHEITNLLDSYFLHISHRLDVLERDSRHMSTALMSIESDLNPSTLDDIG